MKNNIIAINKVKLAKELAKDRISQFIEANLALDGSSPRPSEKSRIKEEFYQLYLCQIEKHKV